MNLRDEDPVFRAIDHGKPAPRGLSDRAVAGDPIVINNGTITGFVQFTGGNNSILNDVNGTFNLRHFADTNGDGVRDTVRVAVADLGIGTNNSFTNNPMGNDGATVKTIRDMMMS